VSNGLEIRKQLLFRGGHLPYPLSPFDQSLGRGGGHFPSPFSRAKKESESGQSEGSISFCILTIELYTQKA